MFGRKKEAKVEEQKTVQGKYQIKVRFDVGTSRFWGASDYMTDKRANALFDSLSDVQGTNRSVILTSVDDKMTKTSMSLKNLSKIEIEKSEESTMKPTFKDAIIKGVYK